MRVLLWMLVIVFSHLPQAQADLHCGVETESYFFEFINYGHFDTPSAYMVRIYYEGQLWTQEEALEYHTRGITHDGYRFGILQTLIAHQYQVKIKSKDSHHLVALEKDGREEFELPCRSVQLSYHFQNTQEPSVANGTRSERLPASTINK